MKASVVLCFLLTLVIPARADLTVTITRGPDNQVHIETDQGAAGTVSSPTPAPASPSAVPSSNLAPPADPAPPGNGAAQAKALDEQRSENETLKQQIASLQRRLDRYGELLGKPLEIVVKGNVLSIEWSGVSKDIPIPPDGKVTLQLAPK